MKSDDLEKLEESQEIQALIGSTKEQYEREKSISPPASYSVFMQTLGEKRKGRKRLMVSPWWLGAACLLGCIIGYGCSIASDRQGDGLNGLAAVDTVVVVCERVDTIYREVNVLPQSLAASQTTSKHKSVGFSKEHVGPNKRVVINADSAFISIELLRQVQSLPDPDSECYAANGMTIAESNYPLHMLAPVICK